MSENGSRFNFSIKDFDSHIESSIPGYGNLLNEVIQYTKYFMGVSNRKYESVDIGCTTGRLTKSLTNYTGNNNFAGVDILAPNEVDFNFEQLDITQDQLPDSNNFTSLFALRFLPRAKRRFAYSNVYEHLPFGGSFIIAEKVFYDDSYLQSITQEIHAAVKAISFDADDVIDKWKVLAGTMYPVKESELNAELKEWFHGKVFPIWRSYNFVAYLCVK